MRRLSSTTKCYAAHIPYPYLAWASYELLSLWVVGGGHTKNHSYIHIWFLLKSMRNTKCFRSILHDVLSARNGQPHSSFRALFSDRFQLEENTLWHWRGISKIAAKTDSLYLTEYFRTVIITINTWFSKYENVKFSTTTTLKNSIQIFKFFVPGPRMHKSSSRSFKVMPKKLWGR